MYVFPQCARPSFTLYCGFVLKVWPVHASNACLWLTTQSCLPSRLTVTMLDMGDLVEMRAVTGVVEEIFWYRKGMPTGARLKGSRKESVESVFSDLPCRPTRVPRRVKRVCEAERETERREKGVPMTSKCASNRGQQMLAPDSTVQAYQAKPQASPQRQRSSAAAVQARWMSSSRIC